MNYSPDSKNNDLSEAKKVENVVSQLKQNSFIVEKDKWYYTIICINLIFITLALLLFFKPYIIKSNILGYIRFSLYAILAISCAKQYFNRNSKISTDLYKEIKMNISKE